MNLFNNKNNVITYTVNKAKTSNMYISIQNGEVVINAPWYMANSQIQRVVEEKKQWIINKINEYEQSSENKKYAKMKIVKIFGKDFDLSIQYKNSDIPNLSVENNKIQIVLPNKFKKIDNSDIVELLINKMYEKIAEKEIEKIMEKTRIETGFAPENYIIKKIDNTLGKCINGEIVINPDIVMYKKNIIECVILHEFCHLRYKNHTKSFYQMIKKYMPDYEKYVNEINGIAY